MRAPPCDRFSTTVSIIHWEVGMVEHFQIKRGQAFVLGIICSPVGNRVNVSAKIKRGLIPTVPRCSVGLFSSTLVCRIEVHTQIKVHVGEFLKISKCAVRNKQGGKTSCKQSINVQDLK